jgi:hypothetical protein
VGQSVRRYNPPYRLEAAHLNTMGSSVCGRPRAVLASTQTVGKCVGRRRRREAIKHFPNYLETLKESRVSPVSETCFRRRVLPSISTTLKEWTWEMNLSVKACQPAGSICCSGL